MILFRLGSSTSVGAVEQAYPATHHHSVVLIHPLLTLLTYTCLHWISCFRRSILAEFAHYIQHQQWELMNRRHAPAAECSECSQQTIGGYVTTQAIRQIIVRSTNKVTVGRIQRWRYSRYTLESGVRRAVIPVAVPYTRAIRGRSNRGETVKNLQRSVGRNHRAIRAGPGLEQQARATGPVLHARPTHAGTGSQPTSRQLSASIPTSLPTKVLAARATP